ncbi:MAG: GAF domain-containing protein, partial [Chloroflexota bacterium]|nr:GAF domain-containing protein [Chloroflexota bacterium]
MSIDNSRLEELFINLEEATTHKIPLKEAPKTLGWTWECNSEGLYTVCSPEVENVIGYTPDELLGKPLASFGVDEQSQVKLIEATDAQHYPVEISVIYESATGEKVPVVVHVLSSPQLGEDARWQGFTQIVSSSLPDERLSSPRPIPPKRATPSDPSPTPPARKPLVAYVPAVSPVTKTGYRSLETKAIIAEHSTLAVPIGLRENQVGLLEFIDEDRQQWSEEEQQLVREVALQLSLALENAYLFQQTESQAWELEVLNNMGRDLSELLEIDEILQIIHKYTSQLMDASNFLVALYDSQKEMLSFPLVIENNEPIEVPMSPNKRGLTQYVIDTKKPLLISKDIDGTRKRLGLDRFVVGKSAKSWLGIPMLIGDEVVGVIALQSPTRSGVFNSHHRDLLLSIARQGVISIQNAQLFRQTQVALNETQILLATSSTASQSLILEETLQDVLRQINIATDIDASLVSLFDSQSQQLVLVAEQDLPASLKKHLNEEGLKGTLCELAYIENETIAFNNIQEAPLNIKTEWLTKLGLHAYLGMPIAIRGKLLGTLCAFSHIENIDIEKNITLLQAITQQIGGAIENANLFEETQQRSQELTLINRIVSEVTASLDLSKSLQIVAEGIGKAINVQTGIALLNEGRAMSTIVAGYSPNPDRPPVVGLEIPVTGNLSTEKVIETQRSLIIENAQKNPLTASTHEMMRLHNIHTMGLFPLIVQNEVIGTVGLNILEKGRSFQENEVRLAETIITQAATAIQNSRLFDEVQRRSTQLQAAAEVSRTASSMLDPDPLLRETVNLIRDRFDLYYVGVFLIDVEGILSGEAGKWAVLRAGTGNAGRLQMERRHQLEIGGSSMVGQCISDGKANISQLATEEARRFSNPLLPDTKSEMALPLTSRGNTIGAMSIQSTEPNAFTKEDISVFQTMADQVANALQNATLFNQTERDAHELKVLNEMSQMLSTQLDIDALI